MVITCDNVYDLSSICARLLLLQCLLNLALPITCISVPLNSIAITQKARCRLVVSLAQSIIFQALLCLISARISAETVNFSVLVDVYHNQVSLAGCIRASNLIDRALAAAFLLVRSDGWLSNLHSCHVIVLSAIIEAIYTTMRLFFESLVKHL